MEYTTLLSLLSLSEAWAKAGVDGAALFEVLRGVVAAARNSAHYIHLVVAGATILFMYLVLFRFTLVPRALAAFGMAAALSQMAGVGAPIFGFPVIFPLLLPLGLAQLALTVWLLARGFRSDLTVSPGAKLDARRANAMDGASQPTRQCATVRVGRIGTGAMVSPTFCHGTGSSARSCPCGSARYPQKYPHDAEVTPNWYPSSGASGRQMRDGIDTLWNRPPSRGSTRLRSAGSP